MSANKPIVIIDDDIDLLESYQVLFEAFDMEHLIDYVQGGQKIPEDQLKGRKLVLTDLVMPIENGRSVIKRVHKNYPETEIWVMSANFYQKLEEEMQGLGAKRIIHKPFDIEAIVKDLGEMATEDGK